MIYEFSPAAVSPAPAPESLPFDRQRVATIEDLLERINEPLTKGALLKFEVAPGLDVYNATKSFSYEGQTYLAARVEARDDEFSSQVSFFRHSPKNNIWRADPEVSNLSLLTQRKVCQDPSVAYIDGKWVVTCVEVDPVAYEDPSRGSHYRTIIYAGETLDSLSLLASAPALMKGVRPVELENGQIGIFTRPQSPGNPALGGRGKIGFTVVDSLHDIDEGVLASAPIIHELFTDEEWGGVNEVQLLPSGEIAVLAHIARFSPNTANDNREYYPLFFTFDAGTRQLDKMQILATLDDFGFEGQSGLAQPKRDNLSNIQYPSGLGFPDGHHGESAVLLEGLNDTCQGSIVIPNPLLHRPLAA